MPAIPPFPIKTLLSQFSKRNYTQDQREGGDSDVKSPVALVGLLIAALTLLVATIPLLRCPRFRRWVSSLSGLSSVKKALGIALPHPTPTPIAPKEGSNANPVSGVPTPDPVSTHNDFSNTHFAGTHPTTFAHGPNSTTREDGRVALVEESLGPRRPEPVVTRRFP